MLHFIVIWVALYSIVFESMTYFSPIRKILSQFELDFVQKGPQALRELYEPWIGEGWQDIFDFLVFERKLFKSCVLQFRNFFLQYITQHGIFDLRRVLGMEDDKYTVVFEEMVDLLGIAYGAIFAYARMNGRAFAQKILQGKGEEVREDLAIIGKKYDGVWQDVLEMLQEEVFQQVCEERTLEEGLRAFTLLMNTKREARPLFKNTLSHGF